jgi:hypothetical protein
MYRLICFVLLAFTLSSVAYSQGHGIKVLVMDHGPENPSAQINEELRSSLKTALELREIESPDTGLQLYADASTFFAGTDEYVTVTMIEGVRLEEAALDAGAENEIWYAGQADLPDTPSATNVRQYMTREALGQYVLITNITTFAFPKSQMESELDRYIDKLVNRSYCETPDSCGEK